jgi:hypothetical protein
VTFSIFVLIGLIARWYSGEKGELWIVWSVIDVSFAVALGILAFMAYLEMSRDEDEVELRFDVEGEIKSTGLKLLRKDCTRGEIVGVLGMMQTKTDRRFNYGKKHLRDLLEEVNRVQRGNKKTFDIPLSKKEYEQFGEKSEERKGNAHDQIDLRFDVEGKKFDTGLTLRRELCTPGELASMLQLIRTRDGRRIFCDIGSLKALTEAADRVRIGNDTSCDIPLKREEFDRIVPVSKKAD